MKERILHIYDWMSAHKRVAALLLLGVMLLCAWGALHLRFQEDISAFLPAEQREQLQQVEGQDRMAVLFTGGSLDDKLDAMDAFEEQWNDACPDIPVSAAADLGEVSDLFSFLSANWPYFLTEADYARMDSLLARPGYPAACIRKDKEALLSPVPFQSQILQSDPLDLYTPVLQRLREATSTSRMEGGCLFTRDGETGIVFFTSPYGGSESAQNAALAERLGQVKALVAAQFPQVTLTSTGGPEVSAGNADRIKKDSILALALAALLICLVLWLSYKRLSDVLWILISIAAGALFALGIISLFKTSVSLIVLGLGCTSIGIAVNYPLHYVDHLKYQRDKRQALAEQVNPLLVGNITTVGAFASLLLLKADALHDFGFIGAAMLVGTILFVLIFLPVFVPAERSPRSTLKLDLDRHITLSAPWRKAVLAVFLVLTGLFWWLGGRVGFDADMHHLNYMTRAQEEGFRVLESLQPSAAAFPLPDEDLQKERLTRWEAFWAQHPDVPEQVAAEGAAAGFTARAFQPFLDAVGKNWEPQERAYFRPVDFDPPQQSFSDALVSSLSQDFDTIGYLCSLIVFLFLWLSFGSLELALLSFLPLAVSWVWIQGVMGLTGLSFNIVNIILATFIFGQGDDYTIFMTEGLMYERATGKKILHSYKNAVVLSALIMFIGIGALVTARHPAMRSLGQVTVIGMLTVVLMAYYLPPLVFRWLTTRKGQPRRTPLTLGSLLSTAYIVLMAVLTMPLLSLWTFLYLGVGRDTEEKRLRFHRLLHKLSKAAMHVIPGCPFTVEHAERIDPERPAVYVCNHQSHLDVLALLAVHPKLVFMTNDWAWHFPLYGYVIRKAGFFPTSVGHGEGLRRLRELAAQGYSLAVFPEGTRSEDCHILRFHRGSFLSAREAGLEVIPLCLHGFGYALPKHDFVLRPAGLSLTVGEAFQVPEDAGMPAFTRQMRHFYADWYAQVRRQRETAAYCAPFVRLQYTYKGHDAQAECRRILRKAEYARIDALSGAELRLEHAGCGVEAILIALSHPDMQVQASEPDEEKYLTATRCIIPSNLQYENE